MITPNELQRNLEGVKARISTAARLADRDLASIRLVAVTKGHPVEYIQMLYDCGEKEIGESYFEEGMGKKTKLGAFPNLVWHMIGHVQSRKADSVAEHFDLVHSVDSLKLARKLDRSAAEISKVLPILLECNVSGESTKFGWATWDEARWSSLIPEITELLKLPNVQVRGLMCIAPYFDDGEKARPYFARLRELRDFLAQKFPQADWSQLSMGMSGDFEAAISEGATILRIGTAILGPRTN
jgi:pyridoxal phosphate enzyme (YggS family)